MTAQCPPTPRVRKMDGSQSPFDPEKIRQRVLRVLGDVTVVDPARLTAIVAERIHEDISTKDLDAHLVAAALQLDTEHPDFALVAGRVLSSRHEKGCPRTFSATIDALAFRLTPAVVEFVRANRDELDAMVEAARPHVFPGLDATSFYTLHKSYFLKGPPPDPKPIETFLTLQARVATAIFFRHGGLPKIKEAFGRLVRGEFTHATPTMFNAGTRMGQLASCFLFRVDHDSIEGILSAVATAARMSKHAGGIGFSCSRLRAAGSPISMGGEATGVCGALTTFDAWVCYCDQGRKRSGVGAAYLHLAHGDVLPFMQIRHPHVKTTRQIFPALWVPMLFHARCRDGGPWRFFCPSTSPELFDGCFGATFEARYAAAEAAGKFVREMPARDLLSRILQMQIESSMPYVCNADLANRCCNQRAVGPVENSNLCTEIMQPSLPPSTPGGASTPTMCNLASINLSAFVKDGAFDFARFGAAVEVVVEAIDAVIDETTAFDERMGAHNRAWRPMGIGVQGFADVMCALDIPWNSKKADLFSVNLFARLYWSAVKASAALATSLGAHEGFPTTDVAQGKFHPDHFDLSTRPAPTSVSADEEKEIRGAALKGMRNSLLVAPMPTASTSVILGRSPALEPWVANVYRHDTVVGTKVVMNRELVERLRALGRWDEETRATFLAAKGSVRAIPGLPPSMYDVFASAFEIGDSVRRLAFMQAPWIDQARSTNPYMAPGQKGVDDGAAEFMRYFPELKTWCYIAKADESTVDTALASAPTPTPTPGADAVCTRSEGCESCSG
jgi:ribonucleoside-diphosphate reductase alpha chain